MRDDLVLNGRDPKKFWSLIKRNSAPLTRRAQINHCSWIDYFANLFKTQRPTDETDHGTLLAHLNFDNDDNEFEASISNNEILTSIHSLKGSRSSGVDGLCIEMYKNTINYTMPYLNTLIWEIPSSWCDSIITPVFKTGDSNDPNNYRAISVCTSLSKIFMKILSTMLTNWATRNIVIDEAQAGFRRRYSTDDNIFSLQAMIQKYASKQKGRV